MFCLPNPPPIRYLFARPTVDRHLSPLATFLRSQFHGPRQRVPADTLTASTMSPDLQKGWPSMHVKPIASRIQSAMPSTSMAISVLGFKTRAARSTQAMGAGGPAMHTQPQVNHGWPLPSVPLSVHGDAFVLLMTIISTHASTLH